MGPVIVLEPRPNPGSLSPRHEPKPEGCSHTWVESCPPFAPGSLRGKAHLHHAVGPPSMLINSRSLQPLGAMRLLLQPYRLFSLPGKPLSSTPAWFASCLFQVLATCCLLHDPYLASWATLSCSHVPLCLPSLTG